MLATLFAVGVLVGVLVNLHGLEPIRLWTAPDYVAIWLSVSAMMFACLSFGNWFLRRALGIRLPATEQLVAGLAVGVLAFAIGIFTLGMVHLLRHWTFFVWPVLLAAPGLQQLARDARRGWPRLARVLGQAHGLRLLMLAAGFVAVAAVFVPVLAPANSGYDARWYHLGIAEQYAARGAIQRFNEGFFNGAQPQLATWLYTWAFLCPWGGEWHRITLAYNLEFALFAATLASLPLGIRWLAGRRAPWSAWATFFLFPGIFLYDSMPCLGADHVLAFWAVPVLLAFRRLLRPADWRWYVLFAIAVAGAVLTRIQGLYLFAGPLLVLGGRAAWLLAARGRRAEGRAMVRGLATFAAVTLLLTAPHWLKNVVWYGDPYYPILSRFFPSHPLAPGVNTTRDPFFTLKDVPMREAVQQTVTEVTALGLTSHDWSTFHHKWPVFFVFFPLGVVAALMARGARRGHALLVVAMTQLGVFIWWVSYHQDRYLGALVPWMAMVTAAALWQAWHAGRAWRLYVAALLVVQLAWSGDYLGFSNHPLNNEQNPIAVSLAALSQPFHGQDARRSVLDQGLVDVGHSLPPRAQVLMHEYDPRVGLWRAVTTDVRDSQGAIDYQHEKSAATLAATLRRLGVTHVVWPGTWSVGRNSMGDDVAFFDFVSRLPPHANAGGRDVAPLPAALTAPPFGLVYVIDCGLRGPWRVGDLDAGMNGQAPPAATPMSAAEANFVAVRSGCDPNGAPGWLGPEIAHRSDWHFFRLTPR
ncbi:MAG TPA: hypothetical protein VN962_03665 [Polyangia bacterium]|nr:hypothetical protein [Polyangia bacterium]